jgi:Asp-tRNA(Asn)/Glu-tRNA(Gln) amidotransferase A subunit family amidase
MRMTRAPAVKRPANLEDAAFWPLTYLGELIRTRQVTSTELTKMFLARLHRYNPLLNFVVSFTDDLALKQAAQADQEIASGKRRGLLHGIPWGCKDIIAVPGYRTTWGSGAYQDQQIDVEATVVKLLRDAGAVLIAKLTTGELAAGDNWFGGRTNSPWDPKQGSSGSSAGPGSATAAGCVAFAIGTETSGSILSPSAVNGVTGLRPTFGRVSRFGAMTLSWSQDRLGPMCRHAEDCAVVLHAIAKPDEIDFSVIDLPFNWDGQLDIRKLRVGYLAAGFAEDRNAEWKANEDAVFAELKAMGVTLEPFELPKMPNGVLGGILGAESGAAFDQALRSGRLEKMTNKRRSNGFRSSRLTPAVEYLQAQRVRTIVMKQFADVVSKFAVYLAPASGGAVRRGGRGGTSAADATPATPPAPQPPSPTRDHFSIANVCGYPAVAVPNGFTRAGTPTSITFHGRLYNEAAILALAKAYQDRAKWHTRRPTLTISTSTAQ